MEILFRSNKHSRVPNKRVGTLLNIHKGVEDPLKITSKSKQTAESCVSPPCEQRRSVVQKKRGLKLGNESTECERMAKK